MEPSCDEKMVVISNEWPQTHIHDKSLMLSSSKLMEKLGQDISQQQHQQQQSQQQALKCPRCDSSNTKFCYYNNYSLSQPRHFCKACKRYWTRGGTLRNVPVGGGCRKNKRVKRSSSSSNSEGTNNISQVSNIANPNSTLSSHNQPQIDINHLCYGLPTNPSDLNCLQFGGRLGSRSVDTASGSGFQLPPQLNHLALGFSSGVQNGVVFGSPSSTATTTAPSLATLLASSLHSQQNKLSIKDSIRVPNQFYSLTPFEDLQMSSESGNISIKDHVKSGQEQSRFDNWNLPNQNQTDQMSFSSSESLLYWNPNQTSVVGAWHDPAPQSLL